MALERDSPEWKLLQETAERIIDRESEKGLNSLPVEERVFFLVWIADGEVNNGGMEAVCYNSTGNYLLQIPEAFRAIGAPQKAACFDSLIRLLASDSNPANSKELIAKYDELSDDEVSKIGLLSDAYFAVSEDTSPKLHSWCLPWAGERLRDQPKSVAPAIIDSVATSPDGAECLLRIVETERWDSLGKRMFELQERLHRVFQHVASGEFGRQNPDYLGKKLRLVLATRFPLGKLEEQMIAWVRPQWLAPTGIDLLIECGNDGT